MPTARAFLGLFVLLVAACDSVPDLYFPDASAEGGNGTADTGPRADAEIDAQIDAGPCAPSTYPCKRSQDCCSGLCTGTGNAKVCAP